MAIINMGNSPDVEVEFEFSGLRKRPSSNGYRPAHLVTDDYLTTGIHNYYGTGEIAVDGKATGTITFVTPEAYPNCLWVGKKINIQEGSRIIGYATIRKIFNPILLDHTK